MDSGCWPPTGGRPGAFWAWGLAALSVREDVALMGGLLGVFAAMRPGMRRHGIAFTAASAAYFLMLTKVWIPAAAGGAWHQTHLYAHLGDSTGDILLNLVREPSRWFALAWDPSRWGNLVLFLLPLCFLPLASGRWLWLFLPYLGLLLAGRQPAFYSIYLYYTVP